MNMKLHMLKLTKKMEMRTAITKILNLFLNLYQNTENRKENLKQNLNQPDLLLNLSILGIQMRITIMNQFLVKLQAMNLKQNMKDIQKIYIMMKKRMQFLQNFLKRLLKNLLGLEPLKEKGEGRNKLKKNVQHMRKHLEDKDLEIIQERMTGNITSTLEMNTKKTLQFHLIIEEELLKEMLKVMKNLKEESKETMNLNSKARKEVASEDLKNQNTIMMTMMNQRISKRCTDILQRKKVKNFQLLKSSLQSS